jgi:hypothetical protein
MTPRDWAASWTEHSQRELAAGRRMLEVSRAILPRGSQSNTSVEAGGRPWFGHREARSASRGRFPRTVGVAHVARPIPGKEPREVSCVARIGGALGPTTPRDQPLVPPQLPPQAPIVPAQVCSRCSSSVHSPRASSVDPTAECSRSERLAAATARPKRLRGRETISAPRRRCRPGFQIPWVGGGSARQLHSSSVRIVASYHL